MYLLFTHLLTCCCFNNSERQWVVGNFPFQKYRLRVRRDWTDKPKHFPSPPESASRNALSAQEDTFLEPASIWLGYAPAGPDAKRWPQPPPKNPSFGFFSAL